MTETRRHGVTLPLPGRLAEQRGRIQQLADSGYSDVWSLEADGPDAFTPLVLAAVWEPRLHVGTAIIPAFTRGPAVLAQSAATLADLAPGRVTIGIGSSSDVIVHRWNAIGFDKPLTRVRDVVRFLRDCMSGQRIAASYDSFAIDGFSLKVVPEIAPTLLVAALRPRMLSMAGIEADGAILTWLSPEDVRNVAPLVRQHGSDKQIVARILVCPTNDPEVARLTARRSIAAYMNVPVYRAFQQWLGRGEMMQPMWDRWQAGDRRGALDVIPDQVVDELVVHGNAEDCRRRIADYFDAGITSSSISLLLPPGMDHASAIDSIAPLG